MKTISSDNFYANKKHFSW